MSDQQHSNFPRDIMIQLQVVSEDEQQPDFAGIEEISREIVNYLKSNSYSVEPRYTSAKGIPDFDIILHFFHAIHEHEALIAAIFSFAAYTLQGIVKVCDWHTKKDKTRQTPFEVTLQVGDKSLTIKASDFESTTQLIGQLQRAYPEAAKEAFPVSNMKINVRVPKKERRRKR